MAGLYRLFLLTPFSRTYIPTVRSAGLVFFTTTGDSTGNAPVVPVVPVVVLNTRRQPPPPRMRLLNSIHDTSLSIQFSSDSVGMAFRFFRMMLQSYLADATKMLQRHEDIVTPAPAVTFVISNFAPPKFRKVKPPEIGKVKPPIARVLNLG